MSYHLVNDTLTIKCKNSALPIRGRLIRLERLRYSTNILKYNDEAIANILFKTSYYYT